MPQASRPPLQSLPVETVAHWLNRQGIADGVPFLIAPDGRYDIELNSYFLLNPAPGEYSGHDRL